LSEQGKQNLLDLKRPIIGAPNHEFICRKFRQGWGRSSSMDGSSHTYKICEIPFIAGLGEFCKKLQSQAV
jgi:hypothetical protein